MLTRLRALFCCFAIAGCSAQAATYYVDQTAGNDSNAGTSPSAPWRNCPGMSAYSGSGTLRAGDVVYFDSADTWLLTGSQGLYVTGGVTYIGNEWGSGARATLRANADLDAGVVRFRDHATSPTVVKGFVIDANGKVATGVDINHRYGALMNGATKRVQDCEVLNIWSRTSLGQYKYGIVISNHHGSLAYVDNVEILNTSVHDTSRDAVALYPGDADQNCRIRNITVRGCVIYNTGQDPDYGAGSGIGVKGFVQDAVIEYNVVHSTKGAAMFISGNESSHHGVGPNNVHIRHNIFHGNASHGVIRIYDPPSGSDPKDLKIYGNLLLGAGAGLQIGAEVGNTLSLQVFNNTFYNVPVVVGNTNAQVTNFEFRNNILHVTGSVPLTDTRGVITQRANNLYYRGSGTLVSAGGTNYSATTIASYESTALTANPQFNNPSSAPQSFVGSFGSDLRPATDGFALQVASPALGSGTALSSTFASSINSTSRQAGSWDRGAYQQASSGGSAPGAPSNLQLGP